MEEKEKIQKKSENHTINNDEKRKAFPSAIKRMPIKRKAATNGNHKKANAATPNQRFMITSAK